MYILLLGIAFLLMLAGFLYAIRVIRRQEKRELDKDISQTLARHQLLANPTLIAMGLAMLVLLALLVMAVFQT
ncbi:hypothetical protein G3578_06915 [Brevibacillus sp. SYP-B805]|uniref:hypothetical protein n=1 Tax=Brevibacillus sp. SYP-B805 TaxID=1578199 RepID=UPI0013EA3E0F|nr:hypothetical protein [Brevibacillus sp. SYP-B805]NGQ94915.1 hypothetical protein [Brevibacillus sp. SYP-B805]